MPTKHERMRQLEQERQHKQRRRNILIGLGIIAGIVVIAGLITALVTMPPATPTQVAQGTSGQCATVQTFPSQGGEHIAPNQPHLPYNSNPPTSGWHWANEQEWGIYPNPQVQEQLVHNLEHGGIIIQYRDLSAAELTQLTDLARSNSRHLILAPYSDLPQGTRVALTAWTYLQLCNGVDENAIRSFITAYRDKGPEHVP